MKNFKPDDEIQVQVTQLLCDIGQIGFPGSSEHWLSFMQDTAEAHVSGTAYKDAVARSAGFQKGKLRGWTRLAFSEQEDKVHSYARDLLASNHFDINVDSFGNLFGRKGDRNKPAVMIGTHLDTVRDGGNYDGVVGFIVAILSVLRAERNGKLRYPVEIAVFRAEESTRFKMACLGSQAAFGFLSQQKLRELVDGDCNDRTLAEILNSRGVDYRTSVLDNKKGSDYLAYFETHIEQARTLEKLQSLGVVTSIRAPRRRKVSVKGERRVKAVAAMVLAIEWIARRFSYQGDDIVGTVGEVRGFFGGADKINAVPGHVYFHLADIGTPRLKLLESIGEARGSYVADVDPAYGHRLEVIGQTDHSGATPMGKSIRRDALLTACEIVLDVDDKIIPTGCDEQIDFFIDLRSNSATTLNKVDSRIDRELREVASEFGVLCDIGNPFGDIEPIPSLNSKLRNTISEIAVDLGIPCVEVPSGAGHDAMYAHKAGIPTSMIFVPSVDGLSHTPEEFTKSDEIAKAVKLQTAILERLELPLVGPN
jgi:N-carbamoyl-L-amino-acid hydrolase